MKPAETTQKHAETKQKPNRNQTETKQKPNRNQTETTLKAHINYTDASNYKGTQGTQGNTRVTRTQEHRNTGTQEHRNTRTQEHKNTGTQEHKNTRTQEHGNTRTQEHIVATTIRSADTISKLAEHEALHLGVAAMRSLDVPLRPRIRTATVHNPRVDESLLPKGVKHLRKRPASENSGSGGPCKRPARRS